MPLTGKSWLNIHYPMTIIYVLQSLIAVASLPKKERYTTEKPKDGSRGINPNLDPERALSFDMTYEGYLNEKWGYQTSLYYNRVSDAIMAHTLYRHGEALFQNQNSGRVDYLGLDIGTKGKMTDWLELGLNYSYIHSDPKQS